MTDIIKFPTFIEGFDEMLGGGIPTRHIIMISGSAGTMKSSLAYSILCNNAIRNNIKSVYVSLEQNRGSLQAQMVRMGLSQDKTKDSIEIIDMGFIRRKMEGNQKLWVELFKMYTQKVRDSTGYELLVIDSMEALELIAGFKNHRVDLFGLFKWLRELQVTVILIAEIPQIYTLAYHDLEDMDIFSRHKEGYLVDGIIHLKMEKKGEFEVERRVRCVKMRGCKHHTGFGVLVFENGAFQVIPLISG